MNLHLKIFLTVIFTQMFIVLNAQVDSTGDLEIVKPKIDSVQRVCLKDSLGITDSTVDSLFACRDLYLAQVTSIREDTLLDEGQKGIQITQKAVELENSMRQLLGNTLFEQYLQLIKNKIAATRGRQGEPLLCEDCEIE
ncbi:hypothetical protein [Foetidibacter luteolus]|uniref:hypothetical protein n=1 Tax=Foetidibacter luteolus TaxID=2608880 RepID=UPI00129B52B3|nr:hypothetical protein [Foetidibacter luteolus]